jgi:hypothetical protein
MNLGSSLLSASTAMKLKDFKPVGYGELLKSNKTQLQVKEMNKQKLLILMTEPMTSAQLAIELGMCEPTVVTYLKEFVKAKSVKCGTKKPKIWWRN